MDNEYLHGGDVFGASRNLKRSLREIYDFSASINPLGPSPAALAAIKNNLELIKFYPDPHCLDLRRAISRYLNVPMENILLGNGASELIYLLARVLGCRHALVPAPTFIEYTAAVKGAGGTVSEVALDETDGFALPARRVNKALRGVDVIFICNPNNPTGRAEKQSTIKLIIEAARERNITIIVDEAFMDFVNGREQCTVLPLIEQYPNLVVLYTLTKFFGIPGLRLGVLLGNSALVQKINLIKDPWNVNSLAQIAGVASLLDVSYMEETKRLVDREREFLYRSICEIPGLQAFPGDANYLLVKICKQRITSTVLAARTAQRGVLVRDCSTFRGLGSSYIRVAVRTRKENTVLLEALAEAMKGA
ncbi:threonine-phosphate decarboxylase [Desulfallas sp. Bu1-1]|uniref:threonine-phosphate decarboxylase CobD n=1 Tax=Desulfallas sp. Bu1-1 TaxID=2787620 RepID=UPI00189E2C7F|nr:threonine-phosphate decarboxylase CobD [Desulfallas sp. Bu1-1]MBF7083062.1 threonine-phosphate decarboxylase [Desulfallas sp. Bu1-1]